MKKKANKNGALDALKPKPTPEPDLSIRFKTGISLFDMELGGGFITGIVTLAGDSDAGKTMLAATTCAEVVHDPTKKDYSIYYNATTESGINFDIEELFGAKTKKAMNFVRTKTAEETVVDIGKKCKKGKPFVYVIDSVDGLVSEAHLERIKNKIDGNKASGVMGTERAKELSTNLPSLKDMLKENNSLLIICQQTRVNIGDKYHPVTKSGGKALKFWSDVEAFLYLSKENLTEDRTINGKTHKVCVGSSTRMVVTKNHVSGWKGTIRFDILLDYGIDDINCVLDYLFEYSALTLSGSWVDQSEELFGKKLQKNPFVSAVIDAPDVFDKLMALAASTSAQIREVSKPARTRRY